MSTVIRGTKSYFMGAQAFLLEDERETASTWASKYVKDNPAIKWILGRYVEADNPNNNRQAWAYEDLRIAQPTIDHAPMNMIHQARNIVGTYVGTEMLYPTGDSAAEAQNPHIEALAAFWKYYFPDELKLVQRAHDEGQLFFSMECVAETLRFTDGEETAEFAYKGPFHESYGEWNERSSATRWLDKPHFLGGALIVPPVKPGWSNAEVKSLSQYVSAHQEVAEATYESVKQQVPHLSAEKIEQIMLGLLQNQVEEEWSSLLGNSNSSEDAPKSKPEEHSGSDNESDVQSDLSHTVGGDMDNKTYTEDELKAAIEAALTPVNAELEAVKAAAGQSEVEARIAEAVASAEAKTAEVQAELDAAVIAAKAASDERDAVVAYFEDLATAEAAAAEKAAKTESRLAAVQEAASFPEDFVAAQTERWVAMSDEDFEAIVEGYKVAAEAAKASAASSEDTESTDDKDALASTAMKAERDDTGSAGRMANISAVMRASRTGFDPRTI